MYCISPQERIYHGITCCENDGKYFLNENSVVELRMCRAASDKEGMDTAQMLADKLGCTVRVYGGFVSPACIGEYTMPDHTRHPCRKRSRGGMGKEIPCGRRSTAEVKHYAYTRGERDPSAAEAAQRVTIRSGAISLLRWISFVMVRPPAVISRSYFP